MEKERERTLNLLQKADILSHDRVVLRAGEVSSLYFNIKKAYGDPKLLKQIARTMILNLDVQTTCIAASGYGGLPLGVETSRLTGLPLAMVRDSKKDHGTQQMIDGFVPSQRDRVSILDDVYTTGSSLLQTANTIAKTGAEVVGCHVVVARGNVEEFELPVTHLFQPEDLE